MQRRLAAILSADVAGYSRLMGDDELATVRTLTEYRGVLSATVAAHHGRIVDMPGDNVLAEFGSAVDALEAALSAQPELGKRNAALPEQRRMDFRIGVNLGELVVEGERIYGDGVNVAARVEALAHPGGICVSAKVHDEVHRKLELAFEDLGEHELKNIAAGVRVYRVEMGNTNSAAKPQAQARHAKPSIIVLPFVNISGVAEQEFFADGLTEDILTYLSRFRELFVISRNTSFKYKGQAVDVKKVARDLDVQYVLEGSVRRAANRVRITAQLIDAESDRHVWAERYDRDLEDIFAIQDEITSSIVATLPGRVEAATRDRAERKPTGNMAAYECVLEAKLLHHRSNKDDNARALDLIERATALDPKYGHAHAWTACILGQQWGYGWCADRDATQSRVVRELEIALALDDNDSDVHRILAAVGLLQNDHDKAAYHQAARAQSESERRPDRGPARRAAYLARAGGGRRRLDPQGNAAQPLPPAALLEPPRSRLFRRAPLRGGTGSTRTPDGRRRTHADAHGSLPRSARQRSGGRSAYPRRAEARPRVQLGRLPRHAALPERGRPGAPSRQRSEGRAADVAQRFARSSRRLAAAYIGTSTSFPFTVALPFPALRAVSKA